MPGSDFTLLLVDDDSQILDVESRLLRQQGYGVICVRSPEEAIEVVHRCNDLVIAAIISDRELAGVSGRAVLEVLRRNRPTLPAVLVSGSLPEKRTRRDGVGLLTRPYDQQQLDEAMKEALQVAGANNRGHSSPEGRRDQTIETDAETTVGERSEALALNGCAARSVS